jgi:hypothetical protein
MLRNVVTTIHLSVPNNNLLPVQNQGWKGGGDSVEELGGLLAAKKSTKVNHEAETAKNSYSVPCDHFLQGPLKNFTDSII